MASLVFGRCMAKHIRCSRALIVNQSWALRTQAKSRPMLAALTTTSQSSAVDRKMKHGEDFWVKNKRMERPMSPHLLIYKFEFPGLLSGSHRTTGFLYTLLSTGIAGFALVAPEHAPYYLDAIKAWNIPVPILFTLKGLLVWPFFYHTFNGVRHLFWDAAKGFEMPTLYKTGYTVLAIATLCSIATAYYFTF